MLSILRASPLLLRAQQPYHGYAPRLEMPALMDTSSIQRELLRWKSDLPPPPITHAVTEEEVGERVPKIAGQRFAALGSKSKGMDAVKKGTVRVNELVVETSRRLKAGDVLTLQLEAARPPSEKRLQALGRFIGHLRTQGLRVPYEDDHVAICVKPAGVHTKSGTNRKFAAFEDALPAELTPPPASLGGDALPAPLVMHRLDVPVSGLCVVAKTRSGALHLAALFRDRQVTKTYHALVVGEVPSQEFTGTIDSPIDDLPALTHVDVLDVTPHANWGALTTLRMRPHTGRTHQLRIHAAAELGCPMVGDDLYWPAAEAKRAAMGQTLPPLRTQGGLFLQSCAVAFENLDGRQLEVTIEEHAKFEALRVRGRSGAAYTGTVEE